MPLRHLPLLAVSIAAAWQMTAVPSVAEDSTKAPCEIIAKQLREAADRGADPIVDTGKWEILAAAGLRDSKMDPTRPASEIKAQLFNTYDAALQSLSGLALGTERQRLVDQFGFTDITPTYIHDFRPASDHLIISQSQGTLNCDTGVIYRIAAGRLEPIGETAGEPGELCWSEHMAAFRVGASVYAAVESVTNEPGNLRYDLSLMPPEPAAISAQAAACSIAIKFAPTAYLEASAPARGVTDTWVDHLLAKIGPLVSGGQDVGAMLQPMMPNPSGDTAYDDFLRASADEATYYLQNLDAGGVLDELPETDNGNYGSATGMTAYAVAFEGHRLILKFGQPYYGSQTAPDNAFGIWEWTGTALIPIAAGDLAKRASHPEITVR